MPVNKVTEVSEYGAAMLRLVNVGQIVSHDADEVCEQHLIVDEDSVVEEVADERLQLFPVVEVVGLLVHVALQQRIKFVGSDWLPDFGLLVGAVKDAGASFRVSLVGVLTVMIFIL